MQQKTDEGYFSVASELRDKMRLGASRGNPRSLPADARILRPVPDHRPLQFTARGWFRNAFAGKYDSFFLATRAPPKSAMPVWKRWCGRSSPAPWGGCPGLSPPARPRPSRGADGLLIQRVSGNYRKHYYLPTWRGSAFPTTPSSGRRRWIPRPACCAWCWGSAPAPSTGSRRLPPDRRPGCPLKRPLKGFEDARRFAQRDVDLINSRATGPKRCPCSTCSARNLGSTGPLCGARLGDHQAPRGAWCQGAEGLAADLRHAPGRGTVHRADAADAQDLGRSLPLPGRRRVHRQFR